MFGHLAGERRVAVSLDHLWAGWRSAYVSSFEAAGTDPAECVFCAIGTSGEPDTARGVLWQSDLVMAVLNAYPYSPGHLLVMPLRHVSDLEELTSDEHSAMWAAVKDAAASLKRAYSPDGLNLGANIGRAAGAGIPAHLHVHVVPRWSGDTNFMTSVAGARVLPEPLETTWARLSAAWR